MSGKAENKRLLKIVLVIVAVGVPVAVALVWYATKLDAGERQRRTIASNEAAAVTALDQIAAAQHLFRETQGEYGTFRQLFEAGVFQAPLEGESLVSGGYRFTARTTPRSETEAPSFEINADPIRSGGSDATGNRHFFIGSEVTGIRYSEGRPATVSDRVLPRRAENY